MMKKVLIPDLSLRYHYRLRISSFEDPLQEGEIIFAYDGNDFIAWICVEEIYESLDIAYASIVGSSYSGE